MKKSSLIWPTLLSLSSAAAIAIVFSNCTRQGTQGTAGGGATATPGMETTSPSPQMVPTASPSVQMAPGTMGEDQMATQPSAPPS